MRAEFRRVTALFVISGAAGLLYQVLFSKALALTFGSTSTATYTVLATYMGGMAVGAWLGGRGARSVEMTFTFLSSVSMRKFKRMGKVVRLERAD